MNNLKTLKSLIEKNYIQQHTYINIFKKMKGDFYTLLLL